MTTDTDDTAATLAALDAERRALGTLSATGVVVERSADGSDYRIVFAGCPVERLDDVIRQECAAADAGGYPVEWKVYGHDLPTDLPDRLVAAGFEPDDQEDVLVLPLDPASLAAFGTSGHVVRVVVDEAGLDSYAEVSREIGRRNVDAERQALAVALREHPDEVSVHVAYVDGLPVSCGRIMYRPGGPYAELAGGRTRTTHRRQGLFTAVVASRLREAHERGRTHAFVDALPTSAPTLRRRGFRSVTWTRPYVYGIADQAINQSDTAHRAPRRVLISYAHDRNDPEHGELVRALWESLRSYGVDARMDLPAAAHRQDWSLWMGDEIRAADIVLVVASRVYREAAEGRGDPNAGRGVRWEARLIRDAFYRDQRALDRFVPVVLPGQTVDGVPDFLAPHATTVYRVTDFTLAGVESLLRLLTGQPDTIEPPIGEVPPLPPHPSTQRPPAAGHDADRSARVVHNEITGDVSGIVIQAGSIGSIRKDGQD